jgi:hypothetical protein
LLDNMTLYIVPAQKVYRTQIRTTIWVFTPISYVGIRKGETVLLPPAPSP